MEAAAWQEGMLPSHGSVLLLQPHNWIHPLNYHLFIQTQHWEFNVFIQLSTETYPWIGFSRTANYSERLQLMQHWIQLKRLPTNEAINAASAAKLSRPELITISHLLEGIEHWCEMTASLPAQIYTDKKHILTLTESDFYMLI